MKTCAAWSQTIPLLLEPGFDVEICVAYSDRCRISVAKQLSCISRTAMCLTQQLIVASRRLARRRSLCDLRRAILGVCIVPQQAA